MDEEELLAELEAMNINNEVEENLLHTARDLERVNEQTALEQYRQNPNYGIEMLPHDLQHKIMGNVLGQLEQERLSLIRTKDELESNTRLTDEAYMEEKRKLDRNIVNYNQKNRLTRNKINETGYDPDIKRRNEANNVQWRYDGSTRVRRLRYDYTKFDELIEYHRRIHSRRAEEAVKKQKEIMSKDDEEFRKLHKESMSKYKHHNVIGKDITMLGKSISYTDDALFNIKLWHKLPTLSQSQPNLVPSVVSRSPNLKYTVSNDGTKVDIREVNDPLNNAPWYIR
jgi:hypothetical protein